MLDAVTVTIHRSQFPDAIRRALVTSLRTGQISAKFHYDGTRQALCWLALHEALSPARSRPDFREAYERSFDFLVKATRASGVHVIGLGCGGGWKEAELIEKLQANGRRCVYSPVDVSTALVITAWQTVLSVAKDCECHPLVVDLTEAENVVSLLGEGNGEKPRLITCFGLLPTLEPQVIGRQLISLVRAGDLLCLSANLAPGPDYRRGTEAVLPQYDNPRTREWLTGLLRDLGIGETDGELRFHVEPTPGQPGLLRIAADFVFERPKSMQMDRHSFAFGTGGRLRMLVSYRYTVELIRRLLATWGLTVLESWLTQRGEEGVFVCRQPNDVPPGRQHFDSSEAGQS